MPMDSSKCTNEEKKINSQSYWNYFSHQYIFKIIILLFTYWGYSLALPIGSGYLHQHNPTASLLKGSKPKNLCEQVGLFPLLCYHKENAFWLPQEYMIVQYFLLFVAA